MKSILKFLKAYRYDIVILGLILIFTLIAFLNRDAFDFFAYREELRNYLISFGVLAPLIIVFMVVLEVLVAPIPPLVPILAAGFLFGPLIGAIYIYLGNILGTLLVFFLARKFGRSAAFKIFKRDKIKKYEAAIKRNENILLAFYFFPFFPLDVISAAFGVSAIRIKKFIILIVIGYAINISLLFLLGDYLVNLFF